jgi:hypothetical protein
MVPLPLSAATHLFVRWIHVLAMAVALGGAVLAWGVSRVADTETTLAVATTYEFAFWAALGALVMTGVGNLGALAPAAGGGRRCSPNSVSSFSFSSARRSGRRRSVPPATRPRR